MAKSLNQAFIKAYTKGRAAQLEKSSESEAKDAESLIVRVDTATVAIPKPHVTQPKIRQPVPAVVRSAQEAIPEPQRSELEPTRENADSKLRDSIASQMVRAGVWQDQRIDAFIGGFPMVDAGQDSTASDVSLAAPREPRPQVSSNDTPQESLKIHSTGSSMGGGSQPVQAVHPAEQEGASTETHIERAGEQPAQEDPSPQSFGAEVDSEQAAAERAFPEVPAPEVPRSEVPRSEVPRSEVPARAIQQEHETNPPDLAPLQAPALSFEEVEQAVTELNRHRQTNGEFFRLDRPSYSSEQLPAADELAPILSDDESGESSMIGSAFTATETEEFESEEHVRVDPARGIEEGLRDARSRIFNPVWEVDSLQWPAVCSELLKQGDAQMHRVAQNLITACQEGLQVLAVTSPQGGEGRTTVACCLAMLAGSHGLNVAIVDGDLDNPTLSVQTNLDIDSDWKNAIDQELPVEDVAVHSINDQVTLLPLIRPVARDDLLTSDHRIASMLQELAESFDLVIVDTGHMGSNRSLVTSLGEQGTISAVVTVIDHRDASPIQVDACIQRIRRTGISSIGLVENFAA